MSDTKITAEERALWASVATARINAVTPERQCEITAQERLVKALQALEQAEARVVQGKTRAETLRKRLMEQVEYTKTILARAEKAEAMADWLAGRCAEHCNVKTLDACAVDPIHCKGIHCTGATQEEWAEAARRAVADESEVKG